MCLTVPARIISVDGPKAMIRDSQENERQVNIGAITDPRKGDWVLVHADLAVNKISPEEAEDLIEMFDETIT